jgi:hypothetical protein
MLLYRTPRRNGRLAYDQHLPHVIAREKELERSIIVEEVLDVSIIEDALQPKGRSAL